MSTDDVENIPRRLREELKLRGLTLAEAARRAGEEKSQRLKDVVSGKQKCPIDLLARLIPLGVDAQYILTGRRAGAYSESQALPITIQEDEAADPLARRKRQVKTIVDQLDEAGLEAVQEELEKIERMKSLEREVAELRRQAKKGEA